AAERCIQSLKNGGKVIFFGNGGSAADAQHLAAELTGRYLKERQALAGLCLTTNTSSLTAIANDYSFEKVFSRQLQALGRQGDVALGISTSGNSRNVVEGLKIARTQGLICIGLTGNAEGAVSKASDLCLRAPSDQTPRVQECHILI